MIQKKFIAEQSCFPEMVKFLKEAFLEIKVKEMQIKKTLVIAEEILVNIISYAYKDAQKNKTDNYVKIDIYLSENEELVMIFEDQGVIYEFNKRETGPLKKNQIGGLGIHFIKELADYVLHERRDNKNILKVMVKDVL